MSALANIESTKLNINVSCIFPDCQELQSSGEGTKSAPNVIMQGHSPSEYFLNAVSNVRPNDLEQSPSGKILVIFHGLPFL
jgi:hypothetical protein